MRADEFKAIREAAGLSLSDLASLLRLSGDRLLRRYEDGSQPVSGPVSLLMEMLRDGHLVVER